MSDAGARTKGSKNTIHSSISISVILLLLISIINIKLERWLGT